MGIRTIERRYVTSKIQFREMAGDDMGMIEGYAARYYTGNPNDTSLDLGGFRERIRVGAFDKVLAKNADVPILFNHNPSFILGRTSAGTAKVWSDGNGLRFRCDLGKQTYAQDLRESIKRGDITQCSFGMIVDDDGDSWGQDTDEDGEIFNLRTINTIAELLDCSAVTSPAYPSTSVMARNFPEGIPASVRSHVPDDQALQFFARQKRRKLTDFILG